MGLHSGGLLSGWASISPRVKAAVLLLSVGYSGTNPPTAVDDDDVYIYIYIHTYIHTYIYIYIYRYLLTIIRNMPFP